MEVGERDAEPHSIERPASMEYWDDLFGFVQSEAHQYLDGHAKEYQLVLACEELISNMIRYNTGVSDVGLPVAIRICSRLTKMPPYGIYRLQISDDGSPFDPHFESLNTDVPLVPIEERKIGGLGLFIIKTSVDRLNYSYKDGRNVYTLDTCL